MTGSIRTGTWTPLCRIARGKIRAQNRATLARFRTLHGAAAAAQRRQQLAAAGRSISLAPGGEDEEDSGDFQAALDAQMAEDLLQSQPPGEARARNMV